jgi:hypothetical protein
MRKRLYKRNVGVMLTEDSYFQLIEITNKLEVTVSEYIRDLVVKKIQKEMETKRNG